MSLLSRKKDKNPAQVSVLRGMSAQDLAEFQQILYDKSGIVLSDNKRALVESRVNQRLRVIGMTDYRQYLEFLAQDQSGEELVHLIDVISTNITKFFREEDHFDLLGRAVAEWAESGLTRLRFWSAACSTGEEPYTMAMTLHQHLVKYELDLKILATDISTRVLAHAEAGCYTEDRLANIPDDLRARYFTRQTGKQDCDHLVADELKKMIMFRRLNFTVFPYPIKGVFDVIFCRNAMIYFDRDLRRSMVREFAKLLRPGGLLMVGHSETLIGMESNFRTIKPSVYQRHNDGDDG